MAVAAVVVAEAAVVVVAAAAATVAVAAAVAAWFSMAFGSPNSCFDQDYRPAFLLHDNSLRFHHTTPCDEQCW